jgi:hypothetical protein
MDTSGLTVHTAEPLVNARYLRIVFLCTPTLPEVSNSSIQVLCPIIPCHPSLAPLYHRAQRCFRVASGARVGRGLNAARGAPSTRSEPACEVQATTFTLISARA